MVIKSFAPLIIRFEANITNLTHFETLQHVEAARLDLFARDAICSAEARAANASTRDETTERAAINADIRQIRYRLNRLAAPFPSQSTMAT